MKLLTEEVRRMLPRLGSTEATPTEAKMAVVKFFTPTSSWTWYAVEGQEEGDDFLFFGVVEGLEMEWGYFSLSDLQSVHGPFGLGVERDLYFSPTPIKALKLRA